MSKDTKSICLVIRRDQYEQLQDMDINVSPETRLLYDQIVSATPRGDIAIEPYLRDALKKMLDDRISAMKTLQKSL